MAGWIKTPLGTEVGLSAGDIVLYDMLRAEYCIVGIPPHTAI